MSQAARARGERVVLDPASRAAAAPSASPGTATSAPRCGSRATARPTVGCGRSSPGRSSSPIPPDSISDEAAPLLEPLGVALHAVDLGGAGPGTTAAVFGCGPIGLLLVQVLQAAGVTVELAADPLPHRAAAARAFGARRSDPADVTVDVAYEAAGDDGALDDAIAAARPGGRVVLVGIPDGDRSTFHAAAARRKELTLVLAGACGRTTSRGRFTRPSPAGSSFRRS